MKTTKESNIVIFPKVPNHNKPPQSEEEIREKLVDYKKGFCDEITEILVIKLFNEMENAGLDIGNPDELFEQKLMAQESVRSFVYLTMSLEHPFQEIAMGMFNEEDEKVEE